MTRTRVRRADRYGLAEAARLLRSGALVAFPTETVYGLGARAFDATAAKRVFAAKGRPADNPLIVHVDAPEGISVVAKKVTPLARRLMKTFWPGPLTLVLDKSAAVPASVVAGGRTVAVRCPSHPAARALIRALGEPVAAPSANRSGRPSPTEAAHVLRDLNGRIPLILDGGPCKEGLESTVVDARGKNPVVLRRGTITDEMIAKAAGARVVMPGKHAPASPGTRHKHYAPSCKVVLIPTSSIRLAVKSLPGGRIGLIHHTALKGVEVAWFRRFGPSAFPRRLFAALRDAEGAGLETLYVETVPERGVGRAVMDRLRRAAAA